jgi:hypothetical protein
MKSRSLSLRSSSFEEGEIRPQDEETSTLKVLWLTLDSDIKNCVAVLLRIYPELQKEYHNLKLRLHDPLADDFFVWFYHQGGGISHREQVREIFEEQNRLNQHNRLLALADHVPEPYCYYFRCEIGKAFRVDFKPFAPRSTDPYVPQPLNRLFSLGLKMGARNVPD